MTLTSCLCSTPRPRYRAGSRLHHSPHQSISRLHLRPSHLSASSQFKPLQHTSRLHHTPIQPTTALGFSTLHHMTPHLSASTQLLQPHQLVFAPVLASFLSHAMLAAILKNSLKDVPVNHAIVHYLEGEFKCRLVQKFNRLQ